MTENWTLFAEICSSGRFEGVLRSAIRVIRSPGGQLGRHKSEDATQAAYHGAGKPEQTERNRIRLRKARMAEKHKVRRLAHSQTIEGYGQACKNIGDRHAKHEGGEGSLQAQAVRQQVLAYRKR